MTIPKYNGRHIKTGSKTITSSASDVEVNADGRIILPLRSYLDGNVRAVFGNNSGIQGNANAGFRYRNVAAGAGVGGVKTGSKLLSGPSAEVIYSPANNLEIVLAANLLNGNNSSLKQYVLRGRESFGDILAEMIASYTENTQAGNTTTHGDLDARAVWYPLKGPMTSHIGVYGSVGAGKLLYSDVKESDVRGRAGLELR